jgi:hypothetical protein
MSALRVDTTHSSPPRINNRCSMLIRHRTYSRSMAVWHMNAQYRNMHTNYTFVMCAMHIGRVCR